SADGECSRSVLGVVATGSFFWCIATRVATASGTDSIAQRKTRLTLPNQPRFLLHFVRFSRVPYIGLRLLISPGRLPLASPGRSSAALPFCPLTAIGNS